MKHTNFHNAQTNYQFTLGPIKIKDGLFMGDQLAAKDIEFIIGNKVTHIINTVSKVVPNMFQRFGIQYLSVNWTEKQSNIFGKKTNVVNTIYQFIEQAMDQGESCLVHSVNGKSRACCIIVSYLMKKYCWNLDKCIEFIMIKKQHLEIRNNFMLQLQDLQKRMSQLSHLSSDWEEADEGDIVLRNTMLNTKIPKPTETSNKERESRKKVAWGQKKVQPISKYTNTMGRFRQSKQKSNKQQPSTKGKLKSILKGEDNDHHEDTTKTNIINEINGNVVHVTVNNFLNAQQPTFSATGIPDKNKIYNYRPNSSDKKARQPKETYKSGGRVMAFDQPITIKSPYDSKLSMTKGGKYSNKKEEIKNPQMTYERPQSANIAPSNERRRRVPDSADKNIGKKRYPSNQPLKLVGKFGF